MIYTYTGFTHPTYDYRQLHAQHWYKVTHIQITPKISIRARYVCKDKKLLGWPRQLPMTIYPFVGK
jgi:hypothetical protein